MLLETKLTGKTVHQKNSIWCWLRRNFGQFDAKNPDQVFLQPFRLGEVSVLQIFSTRNARYEQQVGCSREGGGRGRVMGGVERWRGVWWGLDGMEGDGAIRTRRTLILVKCKNYLAIITRKLSSSLFCNFPTQQYIYIFIISTLILVKCKKITQRLTRQLSSSLFQTFDLSTRYAGRKKYKH